MICPECGFDTSRDYEKPPTLGPVGRVPSVSCLQQAWAQKQPEPKEDTAVPSPEPAEDPLTPPPPPEPIREPVILSPAPEPTLKPIAPSRKKKPWFVIAACAAILFLGIGIGVRLGDGNTEPTVPTETVQLQKPLETTLSPEATVPPEIPLPLEITTPPEVREANTLCSDEIPDDFDSSNYKYPVFGSSYLREQIRSVTFLDTLSDMPSDAWDVSEAGNGKVMAWV